jgi:hypothetical protein
MMTSDPGHKSNAPAKTGDARSGDSTGAKSLIEFLKTASDKGVPVLMPPLWTIVFVGLFIALTALFVSVPVVLLLLIAHGFKASQNIDPLARSTIRFVAVLSAACLILLASSAFFSWPLSFRSPDEASNRLPIKKLMVFEQNPVVIALNDDGHHLYLKATDVSRTRQLVKLRLALDADLSDSKLEEFRPEVSRSVPVGNRIYRISVSQMGAIDANPSDDQPRSHDFAYLSINQEGADGHDKSAKKR